MKPHRAKDDLTHAEVARALAYDHASGVLTWRPGYSRAKVGGEAAGWVSAFGYVLVKIGGGRYMAHRLAWLLHHGQWPTGQIDHINGVKTDNRIENLRDVDASTNQQNRRRATAAARSGTLGVARADARQKWRAQIHVGGKQVFLGHFESAESAHAAYLSAKRQLHSGCTL